MIHSKIASDVQSSYKTTQTFAGFDVLIRDLMESPCKRGFWEKIVSDELEWYSESQNASIHWFSDKGKLFRSKSKYKGKIRQKSMTNLVASKVKRLIFNTKFNKDNVVSIECFLEGESGGEQCRFERCIFLRNREYNE